MNILERIRSKAQQTIQGVGNFIDRDQSMPGVQITPGGVQGGVDRVKQLFSGDTFKQETGRRVNDFLRTPINLPTPAIKGVDFLQRKIIDPIESTPIGTILNPKFVGERMANQALYTNKLRKEMDARSQRGERISGMDKFMLGANAVGTMLPGIDDIAFGAYDYLKARGAGRDTQKGFLGSPDVGGGEYVGAGTSLFGEDNIPGDVLNMAELPLLLAFGGLRAKNANKALKGAKSIDEVLTPITEQVAKQTKKVSKHDKMFLEARRFMKRAMPENLYKAFKKGPLDKLDTLKSQAADFKKSYVSGYESLGKEFKKGSKFSKLTQELGEGVKTYDDIVIEVGEQGAKKIAVANDFFRRSYDEILDVVNNNRKADGLDLISKRDDYYRHMGEGSGPGGWLDSFIKGGSGATDPLSSSIFKEQKSEEFVYDAVGGFIDYLDKAGRAGFTDLVVPEIRAFSKELGEAGGGNQITRYLDDYADGILGIRKGEGAIIDFLDKPASKMRGAAVVGKASTAASQMLNIPTAAMDMHPKNYFEGLFSGDAMKAMKSSEFMNDRVFRFPSKMFKGKEQLFRGAGNILHDADTVATKSIWRGYYTDAISRKLDDAIKYADDMTRDAVGGRGIGDMSQFQKTKLGQIIAPFTLEVQNNINKLRDIGGDKRYGTLAGILVANHFVNNSFENVGPGYRPMFDPIEATVDAYELTVGSDEKEKNKLHAVTRVMAEMLQLSPAAQSVVSSGYPVVKAMADSTGAEFLPTSRELFGQEDPTRFSSKNLYNPLYNASSDITGNKLIDVPLNVASKFTPLMQQAIKTTQGVKATKEGAVKSKKGNVLFETTEGIPAAIRRTLFGKWADSNAKEMFDSDFNWGLTEKQTKVYDSLTSEKAKTDYLNKAVKTSESKRRIESILGKDKDVDSDDIKTAIFEGKSASSKSIEERMSAYKALNKIMTDDTLPEEYKQTVLEASGASPEDAEYYTLSAKDQDVRLQELLPKLDNMNDEDLLEFLMMGRRAVGGKQLVSSAMVDYLYENDYIGENEKEAIKALKYDEIKGEFYFKKSFKKKGESKGLTYKQALAIFKIDLPKFSSLKSVDNLLRQYSLSTTQTDQEGEKLLSSILKSTPVRERTNGNLWF